METQQMMEVMLARMNASMKEHMQEMTARMDANQENQESMEAKMDANQVEIRSTVCAIRSELQKTIQHGMKVVIQPIQSERDETTACRKVSRRAKVAWRKGTSAGMFRPKESADRGRNPVPERG
jgi:hypothetical protein